MKRRPNRNGVRGVDPDAAPLSNRQQEANRRVSSLQSIPLKISQSIVTHLISIMSTARKLYLIHLFPFFIRFKARVTCHRSITGQIISNRLRPALLFHHQSLLLLCRNDALPDASFQ